MSGTMLGIYTISFNPCNKLMRSKDREENEAQRGYISCLRSHSQKAVDPNLSPDVPTMLLTTGLFHYHPCLTQFPARIRHLAPDDKLSGWYGVGTSKFSTGRAAVDTGSLPLGPHRPAVVCF